VAATVVVVVSGGAVVVVSGGPVVVVSGGAVVVVGVGGVVVVVVVVSGGAVVVVGGGAIVVAGVGAAGGTKIGVLPELEGTGVSTAEIKGDWVEDEVAALAGDTTGRSAMLTDGSAATTVVVDWLIEPVLARLRNLSSIWAVERGDGLRTPAPVRECEIPTDRPAPGDSAWFLAER
jgi:hypothetical protein